MNFQDPKIFKSGIPPFGVNDIWWAETPKGTPLEYTLSIGTIEVKTFPAGCTQDTGN